ncbi:unnamed protein product [Caenorhabditis brenneri]
MSTLDEQILAQFAMEDAFEEFKQKCRDLRDKHGKFSYEYDTIEPQLFQANEQMKKGCELEDDCDMDELLSALRVFNEKANAFSATGSTDEVIFNSRIEKVIEITRDLKIDFITISSKIDSYEDGDGEGEKDGSGIGEQLDNIVNKMKEMRELMQLFNEMRELMQLFSAIGVDNLQKKITDRMKQVIAAERTEQKRNDGDTPADLRFNLKYQHQTEEIEELNAEIQQLTEEHESRKHLNYKINEIKTIFLSDLEEHFLKAFKVLNAPAEFYKFLRRKCKQAAKGHLGRFQEILSAISSVLNEILKEIEQNLTLWDCDWEDFQMEYTSRQVKTHISPLSDIIPELSILLELGNVDSDPAKTEAFVEAKDVLFEEINNMVVIHDKRDQIIEAIRKRHAIQQRQEETVPNIFR